jgi:hypothetical protein
MLYQKERRSSQKELEGRWNHSNRTELTSQLGELCTLTHGQDILKT